MVIYTKTIPTVEEQLSILKDVKRRLEEKKINILNCITNLVQIEGEMQCNQHCFVPKMYEYIIPLITYGNAKRFNANLIDGDWWWKISPYDYENRIAFVDWIISELEKQNSD